MDREQFVELMLNDQMIFAAYAKWFMVSKSTKSQGFLDWCWEKYQERTKPGSNSTGFGIDFYAGSVGATVLQGIRI